MRGTLLKQAFPGGRLAYNFEQPLLTYFKDRLVAGEREIIDVSKDELNNAWIDLFAGKASAKEGPALVDPAPVGQAAEA